MFNKLTIDFDIKYLHTVLIVDRISTLVVNFATCCFRSVFSSALTNVQCKNKVIIIKT